MSTKIHALIDALGRPLALSAHTKPGSWSGKADALLPQMAAHLLIADRALNAGKRVLNSWRRLANQPPSRRG